MPPQRLTAQFLDARILADRELNNAGYYDRLCFQWEQELQDPNDVFIEAERIRQKIGGSGDLEIG